MYVQGGGIFEWVEPGSSSSSSRKGCLHRSHPQKSCWSSLHWRPPSIISPFSFPVLIFRCASISRTYTGRSIHVDPRVTPSQSAGWAFVQLAQPPACRACWKGSGQATHCITGNLKMRVCLLSQQSLKILCMYLPISLVGWYMFLHHNIFFLDNW